MKRISCIAAMSISAITIMNSGLASAGEISYDYAEIEYTDGEVFIDFDGFEIGGSVSINDDFFLIGEYFDGSGDFDIDLTQLALGVGYHTPLSDTTDLVGVLAYLRQEAETPFGDADDNGVELSAGVRSFLTDVIEVEGYISYVNVEESDIGFTVRGRYHFTPQISVGLGFDKVDDFEAFDLGVRFSF